MINDTLAKNFVTELLAYALVNRSTFEIVKMYLKYSFLQREEEKKLVQWLFRNFDKTGRIATFGQIQQSFIKDDKVLELLADISDVDVDDTVNGHNSIISTFQEYLKQMKFLESNDKIVDTYNRGDKESAYRLFVKLAEEMNDFNIVDATCERVFADFEKRIIQRRSEDYSYRRKIPTMIDELDYILGGVNGGPETGEFMLFLGSSGSGKSQCLIHLGIAAARQGERVVHFQLEGTKEQCMNRYDSAWTGTLYHDMKMGNISTKNMEISKRIVKKLRKTDIYVDACEEWGGKSLLDVRRACKEIERKYGQIGLIVIDYLELLEVGDGVRYTPGEERFRREKLARGCKSLAMEFNAVVATATQSNDISLEEMNDPEFILSRNNLNEARNVIRPTDIFITMNSTIEESRNQIMRLYVDKAREHGGKQIIRIANNFKCSRFFDKKRTAELIDDEEE
jgi:energy-coupling factor transporter ATP-binding protein EcfA2